MVNQIIKLKRRVMNLEAEVNEKNLRIKYLEKELTKLKKEKGGTTRATTKKKA